MTIKTITPSEIATLKYMFQTFPESTRKTLIENQCAKYSITTDFVREFRDYISAKDFTSSPNLSSSMILAHENLFDFNVWKDIKNKSLEPLMSDDFVMKYIQDDSEIEKIILKTDISNMSTGLFEKYFGKLSEIVKSYIINTSNITSEELVRKYPGLLDEFIFKNRNLKVEWTNSLIEHILKNKKLRVRFMISILSQTKDLAFMRRMLETDFDYENTGDTFDVELKSYLINIPQDYYPLVFARVVDHSPNAVTYDVLRTMLDMNDSLSEEFLVQNVEHFIRNGLTARLAEYARLNEYKGLMVALKLS